jgi:alkylation response protein AidB-like acyl-CoA dehydrogenase
MKSLTEFEHRLIDKTHEFARLVVAPNAVKWERERRIGLEAIRSAAEIGLTGLDIPVAQGGLDVSFSCKARIAEVLAAADFGFAMSLINTQNVAAKLAANASETIASAYLPGLLTGHRIGCTALTEPGAGSDFSAITTLATAVDGGWCLGGTKTWIVNAAQADVIIVYAKTEQDGDASSIGAFLIDTTRPGFYRQPGFDLAGQHSIGTGGFRLEGYQALPEEMLVPPGLAFKSILGEINGARTYVAAMCCGMVDAALNIAADYGRERKTFGKPLVQHQGWRWSLADAAVDLAAARLMVAEASALIDAGADAQMASARAKIFATRLAERHLPALMQAMGAEGLREEYPFGRHMMGARVAGFADGSTEMLLERVAMKFKSA